MTAIALNKPHAGTGKGGLRIVIAGGGTGGHLYPGIAIAEAFLEQNPQTEVRFLGATSGIEARVLPKEGWNALFLDMARIRGGGPLVAMKGMIKLPLAIGKSMSFFRSYRPHLVVGVGGYASGAAMIAASLMGIPRVIQEQNAIPGMTNRVAGKVAHRIYTSFNGAAAHFPQGRVRCLGNPIRSNIRKALEKVMSVKDGEERSPRILIFGGSQGARFLNQNVPSLLAKVTQQLGAIDIVHQTGVREEAETRGRYAESQVAAQVLPYLDNMAERYAWADLAICRAGASTLAEVTAVGVPTVLVPFPYAANDHQTANARDVSNAGGGFTVPQTEWNEDTLSNTLCDLFQEPHELTNMAEKARELGGPKAANAIVEDCLVFLRERGLKEAAHG
jgi:UDP-N-acetylglucosamine--N-acetylmuramyl-(pentapeptide) pyrophosphoryl-undecaprenol N-acetylglucosamine transferase